MKPLLEIYNEHKKGDWPDKGSIHSYIEIYEEILRPYRHTAKNILEIGLMSGESLRMWTEYFDGNVYGIDCEIKPISGTADLTQAIAEGFKIVIGDASNIDDIETHFFDLRFDVIIEDANHDIGQQLQIYKTLKSFISPKGIYIIEDIQDIDSTRPIFENMDSEKQIEIIDRRHEKGRYDDCLVIIKDT